jgi:membrane associated rhomboid family serine protease
MIPIGDDNSARRGTPWLTWLLIAANIFVFVFVQGFGANEGATLAYALVPEYLLAGTGLITLFTSMFLHGGIMHIAGNMLFLGIFGDNVECRVGKVRFLLLYLVSGAIGALLHVLAAAITAQGLDVPMLGASGAISGVLGAYIVLFPKNRIRVLLFDFIPTAISAWLVIGFWFLMQIGGGFAGWSSGGVAYLAHIGGFATGWLWSRGYRRKEIRHIEEERRKRLAAGRSRGGYWWMVE